ncbi:hypothetical protein Patl1_16585 [Pistacia atlantica]|uniref:Uncharacterized protein n=1 Tax=Pistacia atlantica TaxID=434234 RepID=A0ACC1B9G7_9ROSI|nr:hypothetical protein Patl1_16585 [Pistacia atlantica]
MSRSYSTQRDKALSKLMSLSINKQRFDDRSGESQTTLANQGVITQLSEQISSLNDRMDEFTTRIEELNANLTIKTNSTSQQNMALQTEVCNGSAPTNYFISGLGNGSLTGSRMPNSSSSSQLAKESPLMEEISGIARGQRQVMHQLDSLSNLLRESMGERSRQVKKTERSITADVEPIKVRLILSLAIGGLGILLFKGYLTRN